MANIYFIPQNRAQQRAWWLNLRTGIVTWGPVLGLLPADITAVQATCDAQIALIDAEVAAQTALDSAIQAEKMGFALNGTAIKESIANWKTRPPYTAEIGAALQLLGSAPATSGVSTPGAAQDAYKCIVTVKILHGEIRIDWKKMGAQGVHIYTRLSGQTVWVLIGRDTNSPYIDGRPLANPAIPETREYMLRGMIDDEEIGVDSDVQSVTWNGQ